MGCHLDIRPLLRANAITTGIGSTRFGEKLWLKVLFADLLGEKNTVRSLK